MSSDTGRRAEQVAADFLRRKGCQILSQNWRTRWCEIDIVAKRDTTVYFCEVKYRRQLAQGTGLDYITPRKLRQMHFAADLWVHSHEYMGDYQLCAVEVSGPEFRVTAAVTEF